MYFVYLFRLQFEKHFSDHVADIQKEREKEIRDINVHWQHRVEELQKQVTHAHSCLCSVILLHAVPIAGGEKNKKEIGRTATIIKPRFRRKRSKEIKKKQQLS